MIRTAFLLAIAAVGAFQVTMRYDRARRRRGLIFAANDLGDGFHDDGKLSLYPDAAIPTRYLVVKPGSDGSHMALANAGDIPLGVCTDSTDLEMPDLLDKKLAVNLFGAVCGTQRGVAAGSIPPWAYLATANGGQVQALPSPLPPGTYYILGRCVSRQTTLAAANLEYIPFPPIPTVIPPTS